MANSSAVRGAAYCARPGSGRIEVEQLEQLLRRVANAELSLPLNERERSGVCEYECPVPRRAPFAWVKLHTIDNFGKPDDAAQRQGRQQPHSEASLDLVATDRIRGAATRARERGRDSASA